MVLSQNADDGKWAQLYWIDFVSQDRIYTTHTLQLATKYKEKEYILHDYSTKEQNSDVILVSWTYYVPAWNGSAGGTVWAITLPNGETKKTATDFIDATDKGRIISRIKGFMSEYNMRLAKYSGITTDGTFEGIIER